MAIDVTDATFETEVLARSATTTVLVDLWAEWCAPCKQLGPILEEVVDATAGKVVMVKVDVDANPQVAQAFQVQGIPAVYALRDRKVLNGFVGAQPRDVVQQFVAELLPTVEENRVDTLVAAGDEASLREVLTLEPGHEDATVALAELLAVRGDDGDRDEALALLAKVPETPEVRRVAALARVGADVADADDGVDAKLDALLDRVKDDDTARQEYVDLLAVLGPDDPRTARYRKALTAQLF